MPVDTNIIEEKERKLANYLETSSTEEVLIEVQKHIPSLRTKFDVFYKLNQLKLPHSVINTLIYYVLVTNKKALAGHHLFNLANLCKKNNINSAQAAISFIKKYNVLRSKIVQGYL